MDSSFANKYELTNHSQTKTKNSDGTLNLDVLLQKQDNRLEKFENMQYDFEQSVKKNQNQKSNGYDKEADDLKH